MSTIENLENTEKKRYKEREKRKIIHTNLELSMINTLG